MAGISLLIAILFIHISLAYDESDSILRHNQTVITKNIIKENYPQGLKLIGNFETDLIDMNPQETAKNIENISKKYNIDIDNVSETIGEENDNWYDENIIIRVPDEEKILLIGFAGKITINDTINLYEQGITQYAQISRNTIIAKVRAENIEKLKSYHFVNKIREYKPEDKINPYDKIKIDRMISNNKYTTKQIESLIGIYIWPLGNGNYTQIQNLQQLGVEEISYDNTAKVYSAEISPSLVDLILNLKWVKKVDIQKEKVTNAIGLGFAPEDSRELINAPYVWPNYIGSNISIGVYDSGIWNQHPDFSGAIIHSDVDDSGHGTHVSGIIASRGTRDIEGRHDAKGVAYGSKLNVINFSEKNTTAKAFGEFRNNYIYIISNSWAICDASDPITHECIALNFSYGADAEIIDSYAEKNGTTIIFSAGNEGSGQGTITNPSTAKNVITVGAISYTIGGYSGGVGKVATYSSRGPTNSSGRLKPDVVAPGGDIGGFSYKYGVVSTNAQNESGFWLDHYIDRWPTDSNYTRMAGTSMAAPHVSGTVALINESFRNTSLSDGLQPRDYKALLIEGAIPLKGYGTDARNGYANTDVGYGLIDAYLSIFDITGEKQTILWGHGEVIETIQNTQDWSININGTEKKLAIVLAYEDNAGQIDQTHVLKDDLDLRIISPNGTVINYTLPEGVISEEPEEKIVIDNPSSYGNGTWTIRIEGASWDEMLDFFESQKYTVIAAVYYVEPSLGIEDVPVINVVPGANFSLSPTLKNTGGLTVAGVTVNVSTNASGFGGDINNDTFVGNIVSKGNSKSVSFNITAPAVLGEYNLSISAKGINHDLNTPDNKIVKVSVGSLSGWNYRKLKIINGTTAGAQTNYQMKLTVYKGNGTDSSGIIYLGGNVKDDFSDLRFTKSDNVTLLDYWIESYTSGVNAVVWVEVDYIPASPGTADIYVYYGNPSATSASSGAATFLFFDDFSQNTSANYQAVLGTWQYNATQQIEQITGGTDGDTAASRYLHNTFSIADGVIEAKVRYDTGGGWWSTVDPGVAFRMVNNDNGYAMRIQKDGAISFRKIAGGTSSHLSYFVPWSAPPLGTWVKIKVIFSGNTFKIFAGDVMYLNAIDSSYSGTGKIGLYRDRGGRCSYDDLRVRKYVSPEPAWGT